MLQSILMMGGLGVAIGTVLVIASKAFYVYEDPKVVAVNGELPGANCGGCGYPGCSANAEAIVKGIQSVNSCVAAGDEVAMAIAAIMGVSVSDKEPEFAGPGCYYSKDEADMEYRYHGITDCRAAAMLFGGMKVCRIGCLGLGTCVNACLFGALSIGKDGLPKVDQEKCTGCGACERACPKNIIRLTSVTRRIMREYTLEECITPCQRACPTGIDIKKYIQLIKEGDYAGSVQVIKERNPFPTVISRICPAPCEFNCRRLLQDEAVGINNLKRFVCDYEMTQDKRSLPYKAPATGKKVAVIGGGIEGLSAAYFTARLGHEPTVFEATDELGGILRKAIDRNRLDMDVLDWDIEGIRQMGVEIKTGTKAGVDFTIDSLLQQGFEAVFTATGGWDSRLARKDIGQADSVFPGAYLLIDLLRGQSDKNIVVDSGKNIVIAGGSTLVPEAVQILKKKGAKNITVVIRKDEKDSGMDQSAVDTLKKEGVTIVYTAGITKVTGELGHLKSVEYAALDTGEKVSVESDTLIIGSGRFPELVFVPVKADTDSQDTQDSAVTGPLVWQGVELLKKPDYNPQIGLLSDQDVISEYPSVVSAINGGRKAAAAIQNLMYDIPFQESHDLITEHSHLQDISSLMSVNASARNIMQVRQIRTGSSDNFSTGFTKEQAHAEADRCLRCGLVCYEKSKAAG
ncbi:MAG: FAD-dependent oxidoreductase [Proteobacteria bacterium]|nr:FAD-dependent oxidoreductase [Pseudomonadota bacterium]MBU1388607.1 FAD-dependent oxidoreductase [Pseudomonadota bacterium]MBU1541763.1 FAD-dependent oxidoreductase [Pseudomonadota bacterium]MBU2482337.1 FAD-dependent oxidoreductase [Pseudomonadota bacterium]